MSKPDISDLSNEDIQALSGRKVRVPDSGNGRALADPAPPDISDLSIEELEKLGQEVQARIQHLKSARLHEMREQILAQARELGVSAEELLGVSKPKA